MDRADPRCPECGGRIGVTATYCMHCSTDLTDERAAADVNADGFWDGSNPTSPAPATPTTDSSLFHPDSLLDNASTAVIGFIGGFVIGIVVTIVLLVVSGSGWAAVLGLVIWIGVTAHLVTRRTVQETIVRTAYGLAIALVLIPLIAFGPSGNEPAMAERAIIFLVLLGALGIPAAIVAAIGYAISRTFPDQV